MEGYCGIHGGGGELKGGGRATMKSLNCKRLKHNGLEVGGDGERVPGVSKRGYKMAGTWEPQNGRRFCNVKERGIDSKRKITTIEKRDARAASVKFTL